MMKIDMIKKIIYDKADIFTFLVYLSLLSGLLGAKMMMAVPIPNPNPVNTRRGHRVHRMRRVGGLRRRYESDSDVSYYFEEVDDE